MTHTLFSFGTWRQPVSLGLLAVLAAGVACGGPPETLPPVPTPRDPLRGFTMAPRPPCTAEVVAATRSERPAAEWNGATPLEYVRSRAMMLAAARGSTSSVECLLRHGADRRLNDWSGRTALDHARAAGRHATAAVLVRP